jgi:hypothetical protein
LLVLDAPIVLSEYGTLAAAGTLDALATRRGHQTIDLTVSGYGLSYTNPAVTVSYRERLMASQQLVESHQRTDGWVQSAGHQQSGHRRRQLFR